MYLIGNAMKNLVRNRGRYLLLGAVLTALLAAVSVSAVLHGTASQLIDTYADRFGASVSFTTDLRKLITLTEPDETGQFQDPEITSEQYLAFSQSDAVKNTLFQGTRQVYCGTLQTLDQGNEEAYYEAGGWGSVFQGENETDEPRRQAPNAVVLGYSDSDMMEDFIAGHRQLDEGHFFSAPGEVMVSRDLADRNGLQLGDRFTLQDVNSPEVPPLTLTVCGIYLDGTAAQADGQDWAVTNRRNELLTAFDTLSQHSMEGLWLTASYYLKSPDLAPEFEQYVRAHGLSPVYNVTVDAAGYNRIVKPVQSLEHLSSAFLLVVLLAGGLVLILLSMLGVRERKYEIGVLRAMGMPKVQVALGLLTESFAVLVLCLAIGLPLGNGIAQPAADAILAEQEQAEETQPDYGNGTLLSTEGSGLTPAGNQHVDVRWTAEGIGLLAAVSLGLGLITNAAGIWYITRWEPIRILAERS